MTQNLEDDFMEVMDRSLEVERLIDETLSFNDVNELRFSDALVYPTMANWLDLRLSSCIFFKSLYHTRSF